MGKRGTHLTQCGQGQGLPACKFHLDLSNRLATIRERHRQTGQTRQRSDSIGRTVLETVAQKLFYTDTSPVRILHIFAIAMQYTIHKVLFLDFANAKSRHQSQLSEACLPQCRVETDSPIAPDRLTHRCSVRVLDFELCESALFGASQLKFVLF